MHGLKLLQIGNPSKFTKYLGTDYILQTKRLDGPTLFCFGVFLVKFITYGTK